MISINRMRFRSQITSILIILWTVAVAREEEKSSSHTENDSMELIRTAGYAGQEHKVLTEDGYILTVHRVLPKSNPWLGNRKNPVFLQHGLWSSSHYWLIPGAKNALPFLLSDMGYDVWIGNCRGNLISQEHVNLSPNTTEFWNFSFHEMGKYDLPAVIDYILNWTAKQEIFYVGHSMGCTMFFVMVSLRPDMAAKVHRMMALAPVVTVLPVRHFLRLLLIHLRENFLMFQNEPIETLSKRGISTKTLVHFLQLYLTGEFAMYDYGPRVNMLMYNITNPPEYDINETSVPVLLYYGTNDPLVTEKDVDILRTYLEDVVGLWRVPLNHMQFIGGEEAKSELYVHIVQQLH